MGKSSFRFYQQRKPQKATFFVYPDDNNIIISHLQLFCNTFSNVKTEKSLDDF